MRALTPSMLGGLILLVSACSGPQSAEEPGSGTALDPMEAAEVAEVTDVAEAFLAALSAADTAALAALLAPQAMIYSVRGGEEGPSLGTVSRFDFLESLGGDDQNFLERMWDPLVMVQDGVAMVWTPYDFYLAGEFSHCGVDVFTLLKGAGGWQVASVTYNVVREECPPSPLGPPGRSNG